MLFARFFIVLTPAIRARNSPKTGIWNMRGVLKLYTTGDIRASRRTREGSLPADADPSRMQRQEGPGFVTLLIPRQMMGPRW